VSRAQRSTKWCAADPGPPQSLAVPDQRCTTSLRSRCIASGTRDTNGRIPQFPSHDVKQPISFPRSHCCARALPLCFTHPHRGVGGAPRDVGVLSGAPVGHAMTRRVRRLARRLASHDAGRTPLGAPPWRFWALRVPRFSVTGTRLGSRFGGHPDPSQRAPRSQVVVPDGRGPYLPRQRLRAAAAGRHTPLRIQDASRTRPH